MTGTKSLKTKIPKNVSWYLDRRGVRRWRFRKKGFSAELGKFFGSPEFWERLANAQEGFKSRNYEDGPRIQYGTMAWIIAQYKESPNWKGLKASAKKAYRSSLNRLEIEHGNRRLEGLKSVHIEKIMSDMRETPTAANNLLKRLNTLMQLAIKREIIHKNPVTEVDRYKISGDGIHSWSEDEIKQFINTHPQGTLPFKALTIMLYTGMARSDAVKFGWKNIVKDRVEYRRQKTETTGGKLISIPIHPELQSLIDKTPKNQQTFLAIATGKKRSADALGTRMREWCDQAGLENCSSHGLRKAICRRLADAGATSTQIMAISGHNNLTSVEPYIMEANRKRNADVGFEKLG